MSDDPKPFTPISRKRLARFGRYKDTAVLVHINKFRDDQSPTGKTTFVDIRQFQEDEDREYRPTGKGLSIHRDHVVTLRDVLNKAIEKLGLDASPKRKVKKKSKKK